MKAYDGMEAIELLKKEDVQLLLIDFMMPKLDGLRATLKIREEFLQSIRFMKMCGYICECSFRIGVRFQRR